VIRSGDLRHVLEIQSPSEAQNAFGEVVPTWATVTTRRGSVDPLAGRELETARQTWPDVTHKILIRYYTGLTTRHRIKWNARRFGIKAVLVPDGIKEAMELTCVEDLGG
jgi:SPP1 family predicted phage head-tail adaptor